jgi:hypothetical protein
MYASPGTKGHGAVILEFLEHRAIREDYKKLWLETRQVNFRASSFNERHGYRPISNFGKYVGRPAGSSLLWQETFVGNADTFSVCHDVMAICHYRGCQKTKRLPLARPDLHVGNDGAEYLEATSTKSRTLGVDRESRGSLAALPGVYQVQTNGTV